MGFKTGLIIGAVAGYVLGAKAGRERYEQIKECFGSAVRSEPLATVIEKGKGLTDHLPFGTEHEQIDLSPDT
ncbi:MAG TPA: hypothetical protein VLS92_10150 [Acidimicrobiia bacterium]|jgi:hypothetical protein|nr:hypothetical protein [Acidimicrobiia bacterium]